MIIIQIDNITEDILQTEIETPQGTLRDISVIVTTRGIIKQHLIIVVSNRYLLYYRIVPKIRDGVISSQTRRGEIQITSGVHV